MEYFDWAAGQAETRANKVAILDIDSGQNFTYADIEARSSNLAGYLQQQGVKKGERVAILSRNSPHFFELEFACGKIGSIGVPLNWRLTVPELEYILNDCAPRVLMYDSKFAEQANKLQRLCNIAHMLEIDFDAHDAYDEVVATPHGYVAEQLTLDDVGMIMYTSGTTGHPKGAMITHGMNFINCVNLGIPTRISPQTVQLVVLPLFHTGGLNCYANPILHAGGQIILMREFEPGTALRLLGDTDLGITHFFAVPAPYQFMLQHPDFATTDLYVAMIQGWGMTETSPGGIGLDAEDAARKIGSAGKPLLHTQVKIVDDEGNTLPHGEVGELLIRGPNITPGYWNNAKATADTFVDDWLKTGDAARFDEEGFVYIVDRWKDMYISGGENVYPAEIEDVLYRLPEVAEAASIGVPDARWGEAGKAILVLKPGQTLEADAVIAHCLENLAKFKVPTTVEFIDALPRNATGKVLKRVLRDRYVSASAPAIT